MMMMMMMMGGDGIWGEEPEGIQGSRKGGTGGGWGSLTRRVGGERTPVVEDEVCALPYFPGRELLCLRLKGSLARGWVQPATERSHWVCWSMHRF